MVTADTILESLVKSCNQFPELPDTVTYTSVELDMDGNHSNVSLPIVEFYIEDIQRDQSRNTEKVGHTLDSEGDYDGYVYSQWFTMEVSVDIQTVPETNTTHRGLDQLVRKALYRHDNHGPAKRLPKPQASGTLDDVSWVYVDNIQRSHDFALSPSVRGRSVALEIGFTHTLTSEELGIEHDTVKEVVVSDVSVSE